ncbi:MAG: iron ABC transporter permease [Deltaproteobacteria bacterium]|nr:iron ABC transporter permease [Deltaproteobacteria bacterium]
MDLAAPAGSRAGPSRWLALDRSTPLWALLALVLVVLVLLPLAWLLASSLRGAEGITLRHYLTLATEPQYLQAVRYTLLLGLGVGLLSALVGAPMGWLVARTDLPGKLAGPNAGFLNKLFRDLTGAEGHLVNIFTTGGLIFVMFLYSYPYVFTMVANALELIPSELEEAAQMLGAGRSRTALSITLPLAAPALTGGFILGFLQALTLFGSPAILAMPAGVHTITTRIWALFQYPPRVEVAAALSLPLLLVAALLLALQRGWLGRKGYATVGGRGAARQVIPLGPWRWPALGFCLLLLALAVGFPYLILAKAAMVRAWAQPLTWENLTFQNLQFTWEYGATREALWNTLKLGILSATAGVGLATAIAYIVNRGLLRGAHVLTFLATAPIAIPGVVLAVGLFIAYTQPPLVLYGTVWILFVAYLTKEMPIGYAQADATFRGIHPELEDASRILGAGRVRALLDVTVPLARSGVVAAWCFIFIGAIRELSASILLFTSQSRVISVVIFDLKEEGHFGAIAVLGLLLLALTFLVVLGMERVAGRSILGSRE